MLKSQRGALTTGAIIAIAVVAFFVLVGVSLFGTYIGYYNYGNRMETQLEAVQTDNKNILAQYGQKVQEAAQVPAMYAADLQKAINVDVSGTFGPKGSSATMQWFKQRNISLDPQLYRQIQQIIESGRDNFENGQRRQIDIVRQYKLALGSFWGRMWLSAAGYPREDLSKYDIVSTGRADDAFRTHKEDGPIKLTP